MKKKILFVVLLLVALTLYGVWTFMPRWFPIRAYKIPTASMAPTLNGITYDIPPQNEPSFLEKVGGLIKNGELRVRYRAGNSGRVEGGYQPEARMVFMKIGGEQHVVPKGVALAVRPGSQVQEDGVIAEGMRKAGDHVFAESFSYWFGSPGRGDVVIFIGEGIHHKAIRPKRRYIKRVAGIPGDRLQIVPPDLFINGSQLKDPPIFATIASGDQGYAGYVLANPLAGRGNVALSSDEKEIVLGENEYFLLGDNSPQSLDSRYFGPVPRRNILAKVRALYWPFDRARRIR